MTLPLLPALVAPSAWELVLHADPVVKFVMLVLMSMSIASWGIIVQRHLLVRRAWAQSAQFLDTFWNTESLDQALAELPRFPDSPIAAAFSAGYAELQRVQAGAVHGPGSGGVENVQRSLRKASAESLTRLERLIPFLGSTGSAAPFIGLFGTVWGILRAFQQIGASGTTSIAEVGPFIAEALIATAVGLFAAIPAVLGYNYFAVRLKVLGTEINNFNMDFLNLVQRHLASQPGGRG